MQRRHPARIGIGCPDPVELGFEPGGHDFVLLEGRPRHAVRRHHVRPQFPYHALEFVGVFAGAAEIDALQGEIVFRQKVVVTGQAIGVYRSPHVGGGKRRVLGRRRSRRERSENKTGQTAPG